MKKIIMTAAAVLALTFANAQDAAPEEKQGLKIGIKAGWVDSNYTGGDLNSNSSAYFGGLVDFSVTNKFHVQPELLYSMEGGNNSGNSLDFISVPIMAKYYLTHSLNIQAGPQVAFVAGGDSEIKDKTKSTDVRLGVGAAYEFGRLFIDARWNYGLTNLNDSGNDVKSQSFNVGLGFRFF